jgi:hypothetical protein
VLPVVLVGLCQYLWGKAMQPLVVLRRSLRVQPLMLDRSAAMLLCLLALALQVAACVSKQAKESKKVERL